MNLDRDVGGASVRSAKPDSLVGCECEFFARRAGVSTRGGRQGNGSGDAVKSGGIKAERLVLSDFATIIAEFFVVLQRFESFFRATTHCLGAAKDREKRGVGRV